MTQFFVNNRELLLPDDFSFTWTEENPQITSNGEFSLDMTVSLLEAKNAIAFGFLNRKNKSDIQKTADARLVDNGRVHLGSIVNVTNTDISVTFQFLAGNSELKYIAKNEKKIWELDWGTETAIDYARALDSLNYLGYQNGWDEGLHRVVIQNFVCTPVLCGTEVINNFSIPNGIGTALSNGGVENMFQINGLPGKIVMQPYLLYYINKFPKMLGYTLKYNVLNTDSRAKKMYLVNSVDSLKYADALPDMTVTEFKEAIEFFFNVQFIVDPRDKSISIQNLSSSLSNKKVVNNLQVLDSYIRDFSQDSQAVLFGFTKISYDLPDSVYHKYQKLSDEIISKCQIKEYSNYTALINDVLNNNWLDKLVIYRDLEKMDDYCFADPTISLYSRYAGSYGTIKLCNKFCSVGDIADKELLLKLRPSEMAKISKHLTWTINSSVVNFDVYYQAPKSSNDYFIQKYPGFVESVEKGLSAIPRANNLEIALFSGMIQFYNENNFGFEIVTTFPFSHVDFYPEFCFLGSGGPGSPYTEFEAWKNNHFMSGFPTTLRLKGTGGVIDDYHQESIIDTSKEYNFTLIDGPDVSANNIFEIDNQQYMPISLEREKNRIQKTVLAKCYRML